ncbi:MAG TPA: aspartate/glutamate racemase family protein [Casimicrobiaceae bacterium]|nr:aspartate/glutamate racemase family protein [Casimicrobiaceae bacterium]
MLGILTLDTAFPRLRGDVGSPETFPFPVRYATVPGSHVEDVVHLARDDLLPKFVAAAQRLVDEGCVGIATTCGFLARWQSELAAEIDVPVLTSALLMLPLVRRCLPRHRKAGVITYSAAALTTSVLDAADADPFTPVEGVDPSGYFAGAIRDGAVQLDRERMAADVVAAARRLVATHHGVGAIVLECANMPPYRDAVVAATELPVFDAAQLLAWFYAGLGGSSRRHARRDLW